jgi:hypothetical protein
MPDVFDRFTLSVETPRAAPDAAFDARPRLLGLRGALARAAARLRPGRWNEPPVFFFDRRRQADLEAARPAPPDRFADLTALVAAELPALCAAVEVRRVARALDGLAAAARALAPHCPAARDLAELLAVPDDEVFLALAPAAGTGVRLHLRGAADVAQLYRLLGPNPPTPFPAWERGFESSSPLGGGVGEGPSPFQLYAPAALRADGTLPAAFGGCEHWLWPTQPLAAVPRVNGERVVLVGPAVVRPALDVGPRFPLLAVEGEVVQTLDAAQATAELSRLCGRPLPAPPVPVPAARAA